MGIEETDSYLLQIHKIFKTILGENRFNQLCAHPDLAPMATRGSVFYFLMQPFYRQDYITFWIKISEGREPEEIATLKNESVFKVKAALNQWMRDHRGAVQRIRILNLNSKGFKHLPEEVELLPNLMSLHAAHNNIFFLPESISRLSNLQKLELTENQLSIIPSSFDRLQRLRSLYLGSNRLTFFPECITRIPCLTDLRINWNQITSLPDSIGELVKIKTLSLEGNKLSSLPKTLVKLQDLYDLDLERNLLKSPEDVLVKLPNLAVLNLRGTDFMPTKEFISQFKELFFLTLDSVVIRC